MIKLVTRIIDYVQIEQVVRQQRLSFKFLSKHGNVTICFIYYKIVVNF